MDMNTVLVAIAPHCFPVFRDFRPCGCQLIPGDRRIPWREFNHIDTAFDGAYVVTEPASHAVVFQHTRLRAQIDRLLPAVRRRIVRPWSRRLAVRGDEIDTLMRGIVTGHITEVALDAALSVDSRHSPKRQIEVLEIRNVAQAPAAQVFDGREPLRIHPV